MHVWTATKRNALFQRKFGLYPGLRNGVRTTDLAVAGIEAVSEDATPSLE